MWLKISFYQYENKYIIITTVQSNTHQRQFRPCDDTACSTLPRRFLVFSEHSHNLRTVVSCMYHTQDIPDDHK